MGTAREFENRTQYLERQVGYGEVTAGCFVDQPYAKDQHEATDHVHPKGGRDHYLQAPMFENIFGDLQSIANRTITTEGSDLGEAMEDYADKLMGYVRDNAPPEEVKLKYSASGWVRSAGLQTYLNPATAERDETPERGWEVRPPDAY